jgi:hypothetical protein
LVVFVEIRLLHRDAGIIVVRAPNHDLLFLEKASGNHLLQRLHRSVRLPCASPTAASASASAWRGDDSGAEALGCGN